MRCHKLVADAFLNVFNELLEVYGYQRLVELGIDLYGGCFNFRKMRGGTSWSKDTIVEDLNELYKVKPTLFNFSHLGWDPSGDSVEQGPLWIRPRSLMKSNKGDDGLKKRFRQVVGHTQVNNIFDSFTASEKVE